MRAHVFPSPSLAKHAGRFVWLAVDTEREANGAFLDRFPVEVWPTTFVVDPRTERAALKWVGSANAAQIERLLDDGERSVRGAPAEGADLALARADRLTGENQPREAAAAYREALDRGGAAWPGRARAVESLVAAHLGARDDAACAAAARELVPALARGPSFANAAAMGLSCALGLPDADRGRDEAIGALESLAQEAVGLDGLLADDRSGVYELLVEAREARGDPAGKRPLAAAWMAFLEAEAARAPSAEARAAFDSHLVVAAQKLGDPARAVPALEASERDLPTDYNPPARLALLYRDLGRFDDAHRALDRAFALVYGPRRVRLLETRAGVFEKQGQPDRARAAVAAALATAEALPAPQRSERVVARLRAELERRR